MNLLLHPNFYSLFTFQSLKVGPVIIKLLKSVVLMSADVVLKMTTILKEMRIAQLWSKSERTLDDFFD